MHVLFNTPEAVFTTSFKYYANIIFSSALLFLNAKNRLPKQTVFKLFFFVVIRLQ